MSHIDNNDMTGGNKNIYPENGLARNKWGMQYDENVRRSIVDDIRSGKLSLDEMSEMLDLWRSAILKWKGSNGLGLSDTVTTQSRHRKIVSYTRTPGCPGSNGVGISKELRIEIVKAITEKRISMDEAVRKYRVYRSKLLRWCESKQYNRRTNLNVAKQDAPTHQLISNVDKLMLNPGHARIVLDLLLNGLPDKALIVAKALTSTK